MPTKKISDSLLPEILELRSRYKLNCTQISDWLFSEKEIEITPAGVWARLKREEAKGTK